MKIQGKFSWSMKISIFTGNSWVMSFCNPLKTHEIKDHEKFAFEFMSFSAPLKAHEKNAIFMGISWFLYTIIIKHFMGHEYGNFHRVFMDFFMDFSWHKTMKIPLILTMKIQ